MTASIGWIVTAIDGVKNRAYLGGVTADTLARERVAAILKQNPRQSAAEIARQAGVSRQRVHQILHEMGYELATYWRKEK